MATKPAPTKNLPAVQQKRALALPKDVMDELAAAAKEASANETPATSNISFKSGVMTIGGVQVPDNQLDGIIVGSAYERALYEGKYDPGNPKSPVCFALSKDGREMGPHEDCTDPQGDEEGLCHGCPHNEWGSAGEGRRGKACKEVRRLAIIPADKLESAEDITKAEMAMAKIPVTSVQHWSNYVHTLSAGYSVPFWAVVTTIAVQPHIKNQFEVLFEFSDEIDDVAALQAIKNKRVTAEKFLLEPYSPNPEEPTPPPKATKPTPTIKRKF